jgi:hypothetical protein
MGATTTSSTESLGHNQAEEWSTAGREAPGLGWSGAAGQGRGRAHATGVGWCGSGSGVAGAVAAACVEAM